MKNVFLLVCVTCVLALPVQAQEWSAEQQEVWKIVSDQWEQEMADNDAWLEIVHPEFLAWPMESAMPHSKETVERVLALERGHGKILAQDIQPVGIIVTEGTAVIHYYHTTLVEHADGEREMIDGRATDILTRTADGWRYLSWIGNEKGEGEDY